MASILNRAAPFVVAGSLVAACSADGVKRAPIENQQQVHDACYSVSVIYRGGDERGTVRPMALDQKGRVLAKDNAGAFVWDGARHDLQIPLGFDSISLSAYPDPMNERGEIVGMAGGATELGAFVWRDGKPSAIPLPAAPQFLTINDAGQIAGAVFDTGGESAFLYRDGLYTALGPGAAIDINELGAVAGVTSDRVFVWRDGAVTTTAAMERPIAPRINERGDVLFSGPNAALLWRGGTLIDLGANLRPVSLNERGDALVTGLSGAVLWREGTTVNFPDGATAMNNHGQVLARDSVTRAPFVWDNGKRIPLPRPKDIAEPLAGLFINDDALVVGAIAFDAEMEGLILWRPDRCPDGGEPDAGPPPPEDPTE